MRLLSVNRAIPQAIEWQGKTVTTGIFKRSIDDPVPVNDCGLEGDGQADLSVHGSIDKAVYAFPHEHYAHFAQLLERDLDSFCYGQFGENLSTEGLVETEVMIGDRFRIGDNAEFEVSQPRQPCFKLGIAMQDPGIIRPFLQSLKTGFYLRVVTDGTIQAGDKFQKSHCEKDSLSVADITRLRFIDTDSSDEIHKAAALPALTRSWREAFAEMAEQI